MDELYLSGALLSFVWFFRLLCRVAANSPLALVLPMFSPFVRCAATFGLSGMCFHAAGAAALLWPVLVPAAAWFLRSACPDVAAQRLLWGAE